MSVEELQREVNHWKKAVENSRTTIKYLERRGDARSKQIRELQTIINELEGNPVVRPFFSNVHRGHFLDDDGGVIDTIVVRKGTHVVAQLTPDEAIELSNRLVDLVEKIQTQEGSSENA